MAKPDMSLCVGREPRTLARAGGKYVPVTAFDKAVEVCGFACKDEQPVYGHVAEALAEARMKGREERDSDLWRDYLGGPLGGLCGLCGNSGTIDTTGVKSPAGVECGGKFFCICPNGRSMKEHGEIVGVAVAIEGQGRR